MAMDHEMAAPVCLRRPKGSTDPKALDCQTVRAFVADSAYGLHRRDASVVKLGNDLIARIAAARLAYWLEHVVLPAQSVLIDAPHLVSRLPGLLTGEPTKAGSWNCTAVRLDLQPTSLAAGSLKSYRFKEQHWLSRPAWFWPQILSDERYFEWGQAKKQADVIFCEDTSRFIKRSIAKEFMADVPGQMALRYVEMPKASRNDAEPAYRPSVRLSM